MNKPVLPFLETMITQACNLSCLGCTNYSDLKHSGYVKWSQGKTWIESWLELIDLPDFGIIGGEPLINPELLDWLTGVRALMPESQIRLTTNGLLLHKWPDLLPTLYDLGNCVFKITVHKNDENLENIINTIFSNYSWIAVVEHGISRWKTKNNLRLQINRPASFIKTYQNDYSDMMPWQSKSDQAFAMCVQKTCPLLHNGKIFKCSTSGLLLETLNRFNRPNWNHWEPFIEHGIDTSSAPQDILDFIKNFGKPHQRCSQCPSSSQSVINHLITVKEK